MSAIHALRRYPDIFRTSLQSDNRMCLCSFMAAEYDDLPAAVKQEVQVFAVVNVAWLSKAMTVAGVVASNDSEKRARAIYARGCRRPADGEKPRRHLAIRYIDRQLSSGGTSAGIAELGDWTRARGASDASEVENPDRSAVSFFHG